MDNIFVLTEDDKNLLGNVLVESIMETRSLAKKDKDAAPELYAESVKVAQIVVKLINNNILNDDLFEKLDKILKN